MLEKELLLEAYELMCTAGHMAEVYEANRPICKYVHSTSRGHEAIQLAVGLQLEPQDFASPYYRDESMLLGLGMSPYELMLQLLAKADDPFSGGRTYYAHPSLRREGFPTIPHQSSATGMQAIPATGMAHGLSFLKDAGLLKSARQPLVVCSLGDGSVTEGEVAEAFQMAVLKKLPILFLVQDNDWGISASGDEMRAMDAFEYAAGFKGLKRYQVDGADFQASFKIVEDIFDMIREKGKPALLHAKVPLLGHHTSGVRKEWYRGENDLAQHDKNDPVPRLRKTLLKSGILEAELIEIEANAKNRVDQHFKMAVDAADPSPESYLLHEFAPTPITEEVGVRAPEGAEPTVMVDAALHAIDEILSTIPEALFFGQDVGARLGGVFREAATLAKKYGDHRVFNTPIQEAYIVGSTAGMSAVGAKPIVEIQFADYHWTGLNQLVTELSKSCYLSMGQFPVQSLIRIPIGAYGGGGPYHSGSIESTLLTIKGIKVVYPSNTADMKGLMKAAFFDPNPVIILEHKGLYWSKNPGTDDAKCPEPDSNYMVPIGKARIALEANQEKIDQGESIGIITYGMGVYWAKNAAKKFTGAIEILDLRSLYPLDENACDELVRRHGKLIILTEEPVLNSFAESLSGRLTQRNFNFLDAPIQVVGSANLPAVPINLILEKEMLPSAEKVEMAIEKLKLI